MKKLGKKVTLLLLVFISILFIQTVANGMWIWAGDDKGYIATTTVDGNPFFCKQIGGTLRANSLLSGLSQGDRKGTFCDDCDRRRPSVSSKGGDIAYTTEYESSSRVDYTAHQDVAYALAFITEYYGSDVAQEILNKIIWQTDLNESGIWSSGAIDAQEGIVYTDTEHLLEEAKAYRAFYQELRRNGGFITEDKTNMNKVKTIAEQNSDATIIGPYKIDYSKGVYKSPTGRVVYFGWIDKMTLKDQSGNELQILDILDMNGKSIKARPDYHYPDNNEEFYIKFKYDGTGTANKVQLDVDFKYLDECYAEMIRWTGTVYEWSWVREYDGGDHHHHSHGCSANWDCDHDCDDPDCTHDCSGSAIGCGGYWDHYYWDTFDYVLQKAPYKSAQVGLEVYPVGGAGAWGEPRYKESHLKVAKDWTDITMNLGGVVFHDVNLDDKALNVSGDKDSADKLMKDIEVTLYEENGTLATLAQEKGEIRTNPTLTDKNGYFEFKGLDVHKKYYVTYKFNGQVYENTAYKVVIADYNTSEWNRRSKASILDADRTAYNKKFELIDSYTDCYTDINNITGFNLSSNSTYKIYDQVDEKGQQEADELKRLNEQIYNKIRNYINRNGRYPDDGAKRNIYQSVASENSGISEVKNKIQYLVDIEVIAKTGYKDQMQYYPVYDEFVVDTKPRRIGNKTYKPIYDGQYQIHLGLMEREKFDLMLKKDLVRAKIIINNKEYVYEYNERYDEPLNVELRGTDVELYNAKNRNLYERDLRESDVQYIEHLNSTGGDYSKRLRIFLTYNIRISNDSPGEITGYVDKLYDYYDQDYTFITGNENDPILQRDEFKSKIVTYNESGIDREEGLTWADNKGKGLIGDSYQLVTTDNHMTNVGLERAEYFDIYNSFEVNTDAIQRLLEQRKDTKENYAEIGAYKSYYTTDRYYHIDGGQGDKINSAGYVAGLVDRDSKPGTLDVSSREVLDFVERSYTDAYKNLGGEEKTRQSKEIFEDDADKAPGLQLQILETMRLLKGNVWEDGIDQNKLKNENLRMGDGFNNESQPVKKLKVELIDMDMPVEGSYPYNHTQYNTVTDIYDIAAKQFKKAVTYTDDSGNYQFEGYIPGNYLVRYTYGDDYTITTDANGKVINGQDYKSTLYTEAEHNPGTPEEPNYWYKDPNEHAGTSDAQDNLDLRNDINKQNETMNNHIANVLNYTVSSGNVSSDTTLQELQHRTKMYADTEKLVLEVEYTKQTSGYTEDVVPYNVEGIDFGIVERPRAELTLTKDVQNLTILSAGDNQTIFDAEEQTANLGWIKPKTKGDTYNQDDRGHIQATIDENLLHGATMKVLYLFTVKNTGERDYVNSDGTVNKEFYNTGVPTGELATTNVDYMIDYVENNLDFTKENVEDPDYAKYNANWDIISKADIANNGYLAQGVLDQIRDDATKDIDDGKYKVVIRTNDNSTIRKPLIPSEKRGENRGDGEDTTSETLLLSKVLNENNTADNMTYQNNAELIQTSNEEGRRHYNVKDKTDDDVSVTETIKSIPGNYDPKTLTPNEPDENPAETIVVLTPFGSENYTIYIVAGILIILALGVGIFLIKKKVLDRK